MDGLTGAFTAPAGLTWAAVLARLVAAIVFGGAIGAEREWRRKPAGLRTHIMIAVGACLFCLLTLDLMQMAESAGSTARADPIRVIEAVTAGIAFLAAGTILRADGGIKGLTTGAEMWVAGAIGVACGIGQLVLAGLVTFIVLIVLVAIRWIETAGPKKTGRED